jgi:hypothetical protein
MRDVPQVGHTLFVVVPYWVLEHPVVHSSRTVLHVYGAMYLDGNFKERESIVRWERIAARTGLQRSTIFRDVRSMIDAGLIRKVSDGRYQLPMDDPCAESTTMDSESTTVDLQSTTVDRASLTENSENSRGALASAQIDAQFDTTWKLYPRESAPGTGPSQPSANASLTVSAQKTSSVPSRTSPQPMPATTSSSCRTVLDSSVLKANGGTG